MRQFISQSFPDKKGMLSITGKDYRYLKQVLRLKNGDMLSVRLPDGTLQNTTVCAIYEDSKKIMLQICGDTNGVAEEITRGVKAQQIQKEALSTEYILLQYIAKPAKMEQIIVQAVECGVRYILPVIGEFSQKQNVQSMLSGKKDRIERLIREARQQSGSPVQTEILEPKTTAQAIDFWKEKSSSLKQDELAIPIVLWERNENTKSLKELFTADSASEIKLAAIAVGCEGGLSPEEIKTLTNAGFNTIHFPGNILRCETAALYGIAAVQSMINQ